MPYSPGAPGFHHTQLHSPSVGAAAAAYYPSPRHHTPGAPNAPYIGSPAAATVITPGRAIFAQYLAQEGYGSDPNSPATAPTATAATLANSDINSGGNTTSNGSSQNSSPGNSGGPGGASKRTTCPFAREAAVAWCAAQGGSEGEDPPTAVVELASLALAYGINMEVATDTTIAAKSQTSESAAIGSTAGVVRLNARQRRTLRRAQERAWASMKQQTNKDGVETFTTPIKSTSITTNEFVAAKGQNGNTPPMSAAVFLTPPPESHHHHPHNHHHHPTVAMGVAVSPSPMWINQVPYIAGGGGASIGYENVAAAHAGVRPPPPPHRPLPPSTTATTVLSTTIINSMQFMDTLLQRHHISNLLINSNKSNKNKSSVCRAVPVAA